jgi:hypothetical protein
MRQEIAYGLFGILLIAGIVAAWLAVRRSRRAPGQLRIDLRRKPKD